MKKRIPAIALLAACKTGAAALGVVFALATKNIINYAAAGDSDSFINSCLTFVLIITVQITVSAISVQLQEELMYQCDKDLKQSLLHTILYSSYAEESAYHSGDLLYRLNSDVSNIYTGVLSVCTSAICLITEFVLAAWFLASMDPVFTVIIIIICIILAAATLLAQRDMKEIQKRVSERSGKVSGFLQEMMEKLLIIQALDIPEIIEKKAGRLLDEKIEVQRQRKNIYLGMNIGSSILGYAGSFITLVWCANCVLNGSMDYGTLLAMMTLVGQLQGPLLTLPSVLSRFITITASGERLMEIDAMHSEKMLSNQNPNELYENLRGIHVEDLTFSYMGRSGEMKNVLKNADFMLEKDGMTVITGPSGIGKSTILKLLLGIYVPESGSMSLVMKDGSEIRLDRSLRGIFSYAPQGNLIVSGTIRENIMLSNPSASEEQLKEAIKVSCMEDYLGDLPMGLDTMLGENGTGLSEGQIQRVSLARAVLKDSPVLLLDEVTSSLDAGTEARVLERMMALKNRTCIVVTHRPAALSLASNELRVSEDGILNVKLK